MNSLLLATPDAGPELVGDQRPRICWVPPAVSSAGQEAAELAAHAGLELDPWQRFVLDQSLGERPDGKWAAFEVGLIVSRQNGKGAILEARELAGLFLFGEKLILHSAHEFKTAQEAFLRVLSLIENTDDLRKRVKRVRTSHGEEGIELKSATSPGPRLRFVARSSGSGRGFSGDLVILDEAMVLGDQQVAALMPTMSARPNPQLWYTASAGGPASVQLARVRRRGVAGGDPGLAFMEWSIDAHTDQCGAGCTEHDEMGDPRSWAKANPGLGIRISVEHVHREFRSMSADVFGPERVGVGDYPDDDENWMVIDEDRWKAAGDPDSRVVDPVAFGIDMTPERTWTAVGVAGRRADGRIHGEVVDHRRGTGWVVERVAELVTKWKPAAVVIDPAGPAGSLIPLLAEKGVEVVTMTARDAAQAAGAIYDDVTNDRFRHLDQPELTAAVAGAKKRNLSDAWAWDRRGASVDISPLVAVTEAAWGYTTRPEDQVVVLEGKLMA